MTYGEMWCLWKYFGIIPRNNYYMGILVLGVGISLLCLNNNNIGKNTLWPQFGQYTLGIYVTHLFILDLLLAYRRFFEPIVWDTIFPLAIFFILSAKAMPLLSQGFCKSWIAFSVPNSSDTSLMYSPHHWKIVFELLKTSSLHTIISPFSQWYLYTSPPRSLVT